MFLKLLPFALLSLSILGSALAETEVKVGIPCSEQEKMKSAFKSSEEQSIYFYDSKDLQLFKKGVYIRQRISADAGYQQDSDFTVKLRPLTETVGSPYSSLEGFKCEWDQVDLNPAIRSCSIKVKGARQATATQIDFIQKYRKVVLSPSTSKKLGPIQSKSWKLNEEKLSIRGVKGVELERWKVGSDLCFMEISVKVPDSNSAAARTALRDGLSRSSIKTLTSQSNKTQRALEYFSQSQ
jgi:hypothetical protein